MFNMNEENKDAYVINANIYISYNKLIDVVVFCELLNRCIAIIEMTNQFGKVKEDIGVFHIYLSSTGHEHCS